VPQFIQIVLSNPAAFDEAGAAMRGGAQGFRATGQSFRAGTATAFATWQGRTMKRAKKVTDRFSSGLGGMAHWIEQAGTAATEGGTSMMETVTALREGVEMAQGMGFLVLPIGQVLVGPAQISQAAASGPGAPAVLEMYMTWARMIQAYFEACVRVVTLQDQLTARAIQTAMLQLDSEIPFRSSLRAPMWFVRGNQQANNQARGRLANELNAISAAANREREVGTEVPIHSRSGAPDYMRADRITVDPLGDIKVYEVKAGASGPTPRQQDILPRIGQGGPQMDPPAGSPLPRTPLRPGQAGVQIQRWDVDSMPESARDQIYRNNYTVSDILAGRGGTQAQQELSAWMNDPASRVDTVL
jgi:uncharacterized protein YukE